MLIVSCYNIPSRKKSQIVAQMPIAIPQTKSRKSLSANMYTILFIFQTFSWTAPFSLDVTGVDPDIWYSVLIYNVTDENNPTAIPCTDCINITETHYTFTPDYLSPCHVYNFSVIPVNGAGQGESSPNVTSCAHYGEKIIYEDLSISVVYGTREANWDKQCFLCTQILLTLICVIISLDSVATKPQVQSLSINQTRVKFVVSGGRGGGGGGKIHATNKLFLYRGTMEIDVTTPLLVLCLVMGLHHHKNLPVPLTSLLTRYTPTKRLFVIQMEKWKLSLALSVHMTDIRYTVLKFLIIMVLRC